jgi:hypothetical protein
MDLEAFETFEFKIVGFGVKIAKIDFPKVCFKFVNSLIIIILRIWSSTRIWIETSFIESQMMFRSWKFWY